MFKSVCGAFYKKRQIKKAFYKKRRKYYLFSSSDRRATGAMSSGAVLPCR